MSDVYNVPGVYVEEVGGLSLSIQNGETAVPVFVGVFNPKERPRPETPVNASACIRIDSWLDFTRQFAPSDRIKVDLSQAEKARVRGVPYMGSHSLRLYFENGGGPCYVLAIDSDKSKLADTLVQIVTAIEQCPEITLLCWCEYGGPAIDNAVYSTLDSLLGAGGSPFGNAGRFLLADAWPETTTAEERNSPSAWTFQAPKLKASSQVASYFPALRTAYVRDFNDYVTGADNPVLPYPHLLSVKGFSTDQLALLNTFPITRGFNFKTLKADTEVPFDILLEAIAEADAKAKEAKIKEGGKAKEEPKPTPPLLVPLVQLILQTLKNELPDVTKKSAPVVLRASVAMAGVYARVDRERGVWKSPANVGVFGVTSLVAQGVSNAKKWDSIATVGLDDAMNEKLVKAGINAIRAFRGKGTLAWGARTMLPSEQTDWRYISVRRLFNAIERDVREALRSVVFEPNGAMTWELVRSAVDHYLNALWRKGALQGDTPEQAYYVQIGLGITMSPVDIDHGKMIVKIGVAAVRPAEFIVLQLTQDVGAR
ncbi:TPA: phage tail sheath family protein [Serratia marcescens]